MEESKLEASNQSRAYKEKVPRSYGGPDYNDGSGPDANGMESRNIKE